MNPAKLEAIKGGAQEAAFEAMPKTCTPSDVGPPPGERITVTLGRNRMEMRWQDRREFTFEEFGAALAEAPVGVKDGTCYTPAVFSGTARRMDQAVQIDVVVLDADSGHTLDEIRDAVAAQGWRAIIHSTYSHLTTSTAIAAGAAEKWLADHPQATIADYMLAKKGYLPRVVAEARVVNEVSEGSARNLIVEHAPCPKVRVILPLARPWVAAEFQSQNVANATWRERIGALAHALRLDHDQSCVDTSRLFYLPRRRDEAQPFEHVVLDGEACDLWALPEAAAPEPAPGLFDAPRPAETRIRDPFRKTATARTGEVVDLTAWAAEFGGRFEVVHALRARAPGVFSPRRSGVKHHIHCPNAGSHFTSSGEGTGTYCVNASDIGLAQLPDISGFTIHCMHNGCTSHDRLDHLRALIEQGALAPADLVNPEFLTETPPRVDFTALLHSAAGEMEDADEDEEEPEPEPQDQGNIPPHLYADLPGALGLMYEWTLARAPKPQPVLALASSIAFCAAVIGQRVELEGWGTRPNVYILGVAYSGAGKQMSFDVCKAVANAAGVTEELIGPEELVSDAGIFTAVKKAPAHLMLIDEVGFILSATNARNASQHVAGVTSSLLRLYSSSATSYKSKAYADAQRVETVDQPCSSFYGSCTPDALSNALTRKDVTNGLLSRMVIFDAGEHDPRKRMPSPEAPPIELVNWVVAWRRLSPVQNPVARVGFKPVMEPRIVRMTEEAKAISQSFEGEMHEAKQKARKSGTDSLYVRAHENALKFALIRACAAARLVSAEGGLRIDESSLVVDAATMRWAVELSRVTVARMVATTNDIADTQFQADMNALRKFIKNAGQRGATMRDISRKAVGKHPEKMLKELLGALMRSREIIGVQIKTKTRPRDAYVHASFSHLHFPRQGIQQTRGVECGTAQESGRVRK